jgi:hypothetical protein
MKRFLGLFFAVGCYSQTAQALETAQAHVTQVEATYMPAEITFWVDTGTTSCPTGSLIKWINGSPDNVKSVFAMLIAALNSGNRIQYFVNNGDTTCQAQFIYGLPS